MVSVVLKVNWTNVNACPLFLTADQMNAWLLGLLHNSKKSSKLICLCKSLQQPWDKRLVVKSCEISYPLPFLPKQYSLKLPNWVPATCHWRRVSKDVPCSRERLHPAPRTAPGVLQLTLVGQSTSEELAYQTTQRFICKWCLKMQNNEFILSWEIVKCFLGNIENNY